ncbi:MAG TPA: molybdate ABC transporter substrate-binding protein [Thermoanaerobaculia bacterium]|nr:molybdate ABC transporter substrate-binding protein [Thermoanaerobaculia bacterium]
MPRGRWPLHYWKRTVAVAVLAAAGAGVSLPVWAISPTHPDNLQLRVATAANFLTACERLGAAFERRSGIAVEVVAGSTGKLYAQIMQGAPFDLFLAADAARPEKLATNGAGLSSSRVTYALGKLVLWAPGRSIAGRGAAVLEAAHFRHLAIANPRTAPYGAAAVETLEHLGLGRRLGPRLVRGEDVGQTFGFVAGRAAELGFVALAQVEARRRPRREYWLVPSTLYHPIEQQAIIVRGGQRRAAARFVAFLRGAEGRKVIEDLGYGVP